MVKIKYNNKNGILSYIRDNYSIDVSLNNTLYKSLVKLNDFQNSGVLLADFKMNSNKIEEEIIDFGCVLKDLGSYGSNYNKFFRNIKLKDLKIV